MDLRPAGVPSDGPRRPAGASERLPVRAFPIGLDVDPARRVGVAVVVGVDSPREPSALLRGGSRSPGRRAAAANPGLRLLRYRIVPSLALTAGSVRHRRVPVLEVERSAVTKLRHFGHRAVVTIDDMDLPARVALAAAPARRRGAGRRRRSCSGCGTAAARRRACGCARARRARRAAKQLVVDVVGAVAAARPLPAGRGDADRGRGRRGRRRDCEGAARPRQPRGPARRRRAGGRAGARRRRRGRRPLRPPAPPAAPLDLNTATAEQLDALPGIGPATAQKIIAYRSAHGPFHAVAELDAVPGIGPSRIAELKGLVIPP